MSRPRLGLLSAWLSRANGGVFEAVAAQVAVARRCGLEPVVIGLADRDMAADRARLDGAEVIACRARGPRRAGVAPGMVRALTGARLDVLHLHGIWTGVSAAGAAWARATGRPYVVSPHGMLEPWILARGRAQKAAARLLFERRSWRRATLFHALTMAEARDIAAATGRAEVAVVPNAAPPGGEARARRPTLLYLGRIHPKKNLEQLVQAWVGCADARPAGAELVIAGWGAPADEGALRSVLARSPDPSVRFVGPLFGAAKARALAEARFVVLPSLSEGLPMAVLEAWAAGTPALLSASCNLPEGFAAGAAIACGTRAETIAATIGEAFARDDAAWATMSAAARTLAAGPFGAAEVTARWDALYAGLLAA